MTPVSWDQRVGRLFVAVVVLALLGAGAWLIWHDWTGPQPWLLIGYLCLTLAMSAVCFIAYGLDKRRAQRGQLRVSEAALHRMELLGGWPGAVIARQLFRHKTRKPAYRFWFWAIVLLHAAVVATAIYLLRPPG